MGGFESGRIGGGGYATSGTGTFTGGGSAGSFSERDGVGMWQDFNRNVWSETAPWRTAGANAASDLDRLRGSGYFNAALPDLPKWNEQVFRSEYADGQWGNPFFQERLEEADKTTMRGLHNSGVGTGSGAGLYELARRRAQVHSDDFNQARGQARDAYGLSTQEGLTGYNLERGEKNAEYARLAEIAGGGLRASQGALSLSGQAVQGADAARFRDFSYADQANFRDWQAQDAVDFRNYSYSDQANFRNWQAQDQADFRNFSYQDQADFRERSFADQTQFRNWQAQDQADFRNFQYEDQTRFRDRNYADEYNFRERSYADQLKMFEANYALSQAELEVMRETGLRQSRAQERSNTWNLLGTVGGLVGKIFGG